MGTEEESWFELAAINARSALCLRSSCGAVLVKDGEVIGQGYNGPPDEDLSLLNCNTVRASKKKPKSDRTCCIHAEWRALFDAIDTHPMDVRGATMVFTRVNGKGQLLRSGHPYCTVCSRLTLERGIRDWLLWHPDGIRRYSARDYHLLSQRYDVVSP